MQKIQHIVIGSAALLWSSTGVLGQFDATTRAAQDVTMAFTVSGRIAALRVKPGAKVQAGQVLIELDDAEQRAAVALRRLEADSDIGLRLATQRLELEKIEQQRFEQRADRKSAESLDSTAAQAAYQLANLELEQAQMRIEQAKLQLRLAEARLDQFALRAPFDGIVERIDASTGQVVNSQTPILRLLQSDELWIDANVPTEQTYDLNTGSSVWVRAKRGDQPAPIEGRIETLSSVVDPQTDTRLVRVKVPNRGELLVGAHVTVAFAPPAAAEPASDAELSHGAPRPRPDAVTAVASKPAAGRDAPRAVSTEGSSATASAVP